MTIGRAKAKLILSGLLLTFMAASLASCVVGIAYGPSVVVGSLALPPDGTGHVIIRVYGLRALQSFQVGPTGRFTFDPKVIHVTSIEGVGGFQVFAGHVDNANGEALFLAGYPGGSGGEGGVVQLEVKAVGEPGMGCVLKITSIDVLADGDGLDIADYELIDGKVTIVSPRLRLRG